MWQDLRERWNLLTREQKISVVILGICGILAVGLSLYRITHAIRSPFLVDKSQLIATKKLIGESPAEQEARLKRMDTDGDGLADWDETNVYHTNPNLRDSCGDGMPDNIRVATGKNLACSSAQKPNAAGNLDYSGVMTATGSLYGILGAPQAGSATSDFPAADAAGGAVQGGTTTDDFTQGIPRDAAIIRSALKDKISQAELDQITDEQLLQYYDQAVAEQQANAATSTTTTAP